MDVFVSESGYKRLEKVVARMSAFPAPWCVAGGWAIDLFLGRMTRVHEDVDIAVFREDQRAIHECWPHWHKQKVIAGVFREWSAEEWLSLPVHEVHIQSSDEPPQVMEFLLNERDEEQWIFRRNPAVTLPIDRLIRAGKGDIPILAPAVVLLYKAKNPRPKDEADFQAVASHLAAAEREWLAASLSIVHPGHHWLSALRA